MEVLLTGLCIASKESPSNVPVRGRLADIFGYVAAVIAQGKEKEYNITAGDISYLRAVLSVIKSR